jgi:hypothetical protein
VVFIPLPREREWAEHYIDQVAWEWKYLCRASVILFWIPRDPVMLPAFTTNVEFGLTVSAQRLHVLGYPHGATKMSYLHWHAQRVGAPIAHTLDDTVRASLRLLAPSA